MKLPIFLLVLAGLCQALSAPVTETSEAETTEAETAEALTTEVMPTVAKSLAAWGTVAFQLNNNQTSKRELLEGNFGDRTKPIVSKFELRTPPRKVFVKELQEMYSKEAPAHKTFAWMLPQIAKISDVLTEHGPSFEEAVTRHLHSPVSVYQTILSLPTSYEVPAPAASQSDYSNTKADRFRNSKRDEQKLQEVPPTFMMIPNAAEQANSPLPHYTVNQPRLYFDEQPEPLDSGLARRHENLRKEIFEPQEVPKPKIMPLLHQFYIKNGPFRHLEQLLPSQYTHAPGIFPIVPVTRGFDISKNGNPDKDYPSEENLNAKGVNPKLQIEMPLHKQGYHAHPNGAISFARFTHNLHGSTQHDTAPQPQSETFHQPQQLYQYRHQPETLNALQQHLLLQEPRQSYRQRLPAFIALPESLLTPEFDLKKENQSPIITEKTPRPFSYSGLSENYDLSLGQASAQLNSLPSLNLNYSKNDKPLEPNNALVFLPTLPTSTAKVEPVSDQLISSTTIQPDVKGQENPTTQSIQEETELQSKTSQPLKPEVFHPSQLTVQPASIQSTTYLPFVTKEPQSIFFQYSTPQPIRLRPYQFMSQPTYQSTSQPSYQSTPRPTPQRHDVVIQRQEIQEIFFEPTHQPSFKPRHRNKPAQVSSSDEELLQFRAQHPIYELFEQLMPYKPEYQDVHSPQQYIVETRESQQQPLLQFQQQLLQRQQPELEQSHQQQQGLNQAHHEESQLAHQQQQHASEQAQQQIQIYKQELQQQYQQNSLEPSNQIQISTLTPPQDTEKQTETVEIQQQTESQTELQQDSKLQSSTEKPDEPPKHLLGPTLHLQRPYLDPSLTPSVVPQFYGQQGRQQLVTELKLVNHSPLSDVPAHSDVQYFIG